MSTAIQIKSVEEAEFSRFNYISQLSEVNLSEASSDIEVLRVKKIWGRNLTITGDMLDDFVKNFRENVYGVDLQVNLGHVREGEAAGWIRNLYRKGDCLYATVEWTPLGQEKVASRQFRYTSSELELRHQHHETGDIVKNVLIGVALTNIPAVKGMAPVTLSDEVESFINLEESMDKVKSMYADLMKKDKISKEEMNTFKEACAEFKDNKEVSEMMSKVTGRSNNSEEKVDEGSKGEEGSEEGKKEEKQPDAELSQRLSEQGLTVLSKTALEKLQEQAARGAEAAEKLRRNDLSEEVKREFCLSETRQTGFKADDVGKVAEFVATLSEEQVKSFKVVMGLMTHVDLSERGVDAPSKSVADSKDEVAKFAEAQKEAEQLSATSGRNLADCLTEVYHKYKLV